MTPVAPFYCTAWSIYSLISCFFPLCHYQAAPFYSAVTWLLQLPQGDTFNAFIGLMNATLARRLFYSYIFYVLAYRSYASPHAAICTPLLYLITSWELQFEISIKVTGLVLPMLLTCCSHDGLLWLQYFRKLCFLYFDRKMKKNLSFSPRRITDMKTGLLKTTFHPLSTDVLRARIGERT